MNNIIYEEQLLLNTTVIRMYFREVLTLLSRTILRNNNKPRPVRERT
jgi:hypothetical protein